MKKISHHAKTKGGEKICPEGKEGGQEKPPLFRVNRKRKRGRRGTTFGSLGFLPSGEGRISVLQGERKERCP